MPYKNLRPCSPPSHTLPKEITLNVESKKKEEKEEKEEKGEYEAGKGMEKEETKLTKSNSTNVVYVRL
jgi:hypothetical protein